VTGSKWSVLQNRAEGTQEMKSECRSYAQKSINILRRESTDLDEHMFRDRALCLRNDLQNAPSSRTGVVHGIYWQLKICLAAATVLFSYRLCNRYFQTVDHIMYTARSNDKPYKIHEFSHTFQQYFLSV
jgi:hypothetical protein